LAELKLIRAMDNLKWTAKTVIGEFENIILSQLFDLQGFNK